MRNVCGIYIIKNKESGAYYIGSSKNISHRWWKHKRRLNKNIHCNQYLQNSWNKYGEKSFEFIVVEETDLQHLIEREQWWLDKAKSTSGILFNLTFIAGGGDTLTNHPNRKAIIEKMSKITSGAGNPMYGRKHSEETKKRWSILRQGQFSGSKHPQYGKFLSEETKLKIANIKSKILWKFLSPTKEIVEIRNLAKFCREHNLCNGAMGKVATGKATHHKGWITISV